MSDQAPGPNLMAFLKGALPYLPGLAGAALSMAFGERLGVRGKALSLIVGVATALFVAPGFAAMISLVWPGGSIPQEVLSLIGFSSGLFGMTICAGLIEWVPKWMAKLKVKLGPLSIEGGGE